MTRGLDAGLSPEVYESIRTRRVPKFASEQEKLVYDLVNELIETKTVSGEATTEQLSFWVWITLSSHHWSGILHDHRHGTQHLRCFGPRICQGP